MPVRVTTGVVRIGHLIRDKRMSEGLDQSQLASRFGVSQTTISNWETHTRQPPEEVYGPLAEWLGMSRADLILAIHQAEPAVTDPVASLEARLARMEAALAELVGLLRAQLGREPGDPKA